MAQPDKILVVGYGNSLRSDDGAAHAVVSRLQQQELPQVQVLSVHQLTPELAETLSQVQRAIFVDVYMAHGETQLRVEPLPSQEQLAREARWKWIHQATPRSLLALTQFVYGSTPEAWWVLIPAVNLALGETTSATAQAGIDAATAYILQQIHQWQRDS
ncbi:hydrogenase maturation protease [Geitlerinema sp. PCC 9228]|jgi:hydrogenase maturation protease|uniref:hydrogenase maturation protease n=1 Tax=Geitlerinema sp. PCC 9228 TaxID=111611 RepID=UPI0008F9853C|nr:hydrogenase maturation protease [Geitlerinema sp. PCC 9228]